MEDHFTRLWTNLKSAAKVFVLFSVFGLLGLLQVGVPRTSFADEAALAGEQAITEGEAAEPSAPVTLDGNMLFRVRGTSSYPPQRRADVILGRILDLAHDPSFQTSSLTTVETEHWTDVVAGQKLVLSVFDADARLEGLGRHEVAIGISVRIGEAIEHYRRDRNPEKLRRGAIYAAVATAALIAALFLALWILRRISRVVEYRYKARTRDLKVGSFDVIQAGRIWTMIRGSVNAIRIAGVLTFLYVYLQFTLSLFPWTRVVATDLLGLVVNPLASMGRAVVAYLPNLAFLIILVVVTRYLLKMIRYFFLRIEYGRLVLEGFEPEWARSTYKLVRGLIVVFAVVVAYPYVPGSGSEAFKGVSIFIGLIFSLGSSSAIANVIAGYTLVYRRTFKVGDVIQVGDVFGCVIEMRLQATHVRTVKNEVVIVPNSLILSSSVMNFTRLAKTNGLILHSIVGVGYEASWRQVEAMLLLAADLTPGFKKDPPPFVLQKALDDFAVKYEINAYCDNPMQIARLYTELHRNILDQFNEHGVQIMTPAYESDPQAPKVVPKDQWYAAPAKPQEDKAQDKNLKDKP